MPVVDWRDGVLTQQIPECPVSCLPMFVELWGRQSLDTGVTPISCVRDNEEGKGYRGRVKEDDRGL